MLAAPSCAFCHTSAPFALRTFDARIQAADNTLAGPLFFCGSAHAPAHLFPNTEFASPSRTPVPPAPVPIAPCQNKSHLHEVYVHELCTLWAPTCYAGQHQFMNVLTELKRASKAVRDLR